MKSPISGDHPFGLDRVALREEGVVRIYPEIPLGLLKIKTNLNSII